MEGLLGSGSWLYVIFIGFIVGLLARFLKPGNDGMGIILTILLGIAGAVLAVSSASKWAGTRQDRRQDSSARLSAPS
jgi:uncharacterized membrane protein YeaQ/YmgE (transglycosylase-associated protein family)